MKLLQKSSAFKKPKNAKELYISDQEGDQATEYYPGVTR